MGDLSGRSALVTGASTGLGEAIARLFAHHGAHVFVADIDEGRGQIVADAIGGTFQRLDISVEEQWADAIAALENRCGKLDILVNNAAIFRPNIAFLDMDLSTWRQHMAVNMDGTFLGCQYGIRAMQKHRSGSIINIASGMALLAIPTASAYATSKAAVLMITRLASRVGGPSGIRVNAILPGAVVTDQLRGNLEPGETMEDFVTKKLLPMYPLGRIGQPDDIAEAALYLASDRSSFVSGNLLRVDGAQDP